jgi:hypothetical protein
MTGISANRAFDLTGPATVTRSKTARRLVTFGRMVVFATSKSLQDKTNFQMPTGRQVDLCEDLAETIAPFVEGQADFIAMRLITAFRSIDAVLAANARELAAIVPDEPRLVRALTTSRYFSALGFA